MYIYIYVYIYTYKYIICMYVYITYLTGSLNRKSCYNLRCYNSYFAKSCVKC